MARLVVLSLFALCLVGTALAGPNSTTKGVADELDDMFIYKCCISKQSYLKTAVAAAVEKAKNAITGKKEEADTKELGIKCTKELCQHIVNEQKAILESIEAMKTNPANMLTKEKFMAAHAKGERLHSPIPDSYLFAAGKKRPQVPKKPSELVALAPSAPAATAPGAFVELGNPATSLWDKARIPFKYSAELQPSITTLGADLKTVKKMYIAAMDEWSKHTCVEFVPDATATVEFQKSASSAWTTGIGRNCRSVNVPADETWYGVTEHELGHLIGLEHTNKRSDRAAYMTYDDGKCDTYWQTGDCSIAQLNTPRLADELTAAKTTCNSKTFDEIGAALGLAAGVYQNTTAEFEQCMTLMCTRKWKYQYAESTNPLPAGVDYEYASIMHYPFDNQCITMVNPRNAKGGNGNPPGTSITKRDFQVVNTHYGCIEVKFASPDSWSITPWFFKEKIIHTHPGLTLVEFKAKIQNFLTTTKALKVSLMSNKVEWVGDNELVSKFLADHAVVAKSIVLDVQYA